MASQKTPFVVVHAMRNYRIIPDIPLDNGEGRCNNPSCPNPTIYWCKAVLNAETGKQLPLDEPFTGLRPPLIHGCMKEFRPGVFLKKYADEESEPVKEKKPWPLPLPEGVHLGTTHLWLQDKREFVTLYKCPLCSFQNIHKDIINHHIKYAVDEYHNKSGIVI